MSSSVQPVGSVELIFGLAAERQSTEPAVGPCLVCRDRAADRGHRLADLGLGGRLPNFRASPPISSRPRRRFGHETSALPGNVAWHTLVTGKTVAARVSRFGPRQPARWRCSSPLRRLVAGAVYPLLVLTQAIPKVALAPILVVVLGTSELPRVVVTFLVAFFPLVLSVASGLVSVPPDLIELGRACQASRWTELWRIRLPYRRALHLQWPQGRHRAGGRRCRGRRVRQRRCWPGLPDPDVDRVFQSTACLGRIDHSFDHGDRAVPDYAWRSNASSSLGLPASTSRPFKEEHSMADQRMSIVRNGRVLDIRGHRAPPADILIAGDTIVEVGAPGLAAPDDAALVDATDRLIHPGLINAHTHGHGNLSKGMGDRWTLELLLTAAPWISGNRAAEDKYLSHVHRRAWRCCSRAAPPATTSRSSSRNRRPRASVPAPRPMPMRVCGRWWRRWSRASHSTRPSPACSTSFRPACRRTSSV